MGSALRRGFRTLPSRAMPVLGGRAQSGAGHAPRSLASSRITEAHRSRKTGAAIPAAGSACVIPPGQIPRDHRRISAPGVCRPRAIPYSPRRRAQRESELRRFSGPRKPGAKDGQRATRRAFFARWGGVRRGPRTAAGRRLCAPARSLGLQPGRPVRAGEVPVDLVPAVRELLAKRRVGSGKTGHSTMSPQVTII